MMRNKSFLLSLFMVLLSCAQITPQVVAEGTVLRSRIIGGNIEFLVKIDEGIFYYYKMSISDNDELIPLQIVHDSANARALFPFYDDRIKGIDGLMERYPAIKIEIDRHLALLKQSLMKSETGEIWLTYSILRYADFDNKIYVIVSFSDSERYYGGLFLSCAGVGQESKILSSLELVSDDSETLVSCEIIDKNRVVVFIEKNNKTVVKIIKILS